MPPFHSASSTTSPLRSFAVVRGTSPTPSLFLSHLLAGTLARRSSALPLRSHARSPLPLRIAQTPLSCSRSHELTPRPKPEPFSDRNREFVIRWQTSGKSPPPNLDAGVCTAAARPIKPQPSDLDPRAQIQPKPQVKQNIPVNLALLQKSPPVFPKLTRSPIQFKNLFKVVLSFVF